MSLHIQASADQIAESVIISGDPLRLRFIADKFLANAVCYNERRGMLGFTGMYNGKLVSLQGTGMGIPSTAIYVHELIHEYGAKRIIRLGTCGALQTNLKLGDIILAESAFTDSNTHLLHYSNMDLATTANRKLFEHAIKTAESFGIRTQQGVIFSTDTFYGELSRWDPWILRGVLGIDMETSILYSLADKNEVEALSVLVVSDNLITNESTSASEREEISLNAAKLVLEIA